MVIRPGLVYWSRQDWGARADKPRLGHPVSKSQRALVIIHHTVIIDNDATPNIWETIAEVKAKMVQLQTIRPDLGEDVPYNFVMFLMADGTIIVCEGRGIALTGAHTHGRNTDGIGVAFQGNFQLAVNIGPFVPIISQFLGWLKHDQGLSGLGPIEGHRDHSATACPGTNLYDVLGQLTYAPAQKEELTVGQYEELKGLIAKLDTRLDIIEGSAAPAPPSAPAPTPPPPSPGLTHTVISGDELGEIALKFKSRWPAGLALWGNSGAVAKLAAHNRINPNAGLSVGQVLKIPW